MIEAMRGRLLIVDDDAIFREVLASALERRGFLVDLAAGLEDGRRLQARERPDHAVVDLNLPDGNGLVLVDEFCRRDPDIRVLILTGYASIATAVEGIKLGAHYYLTKPVDADQIVTALEREAGGDPNVPPARTPMSVRRLEWEHIQRVLQEVDGNVSEAARRLGMHRRTLQRKLRKRPVRR